MRIRTKLYLCFGVLLLLTLLLSSIAVKITGQLKDNMNEVVLKRYEEVHLTNSFRYEFNSIITEFKDLHLLDVDQKGIEERLKKIEASREKSLIALDTLEQVNIDQRVSELLPELKVKYNAHLELQKELEKLLISGQKVEATELVAIVGTSLRDSIFAVVDEILLSEENMMRDALQHTENLYRQAVWAFIAILISGTLFFFAFSFISFRSVTGNIKKMTNVMGCITYADSLDQLPRVNIAVNDEIGEIADAFNEMAGVLEEQMKQKKVYNQAIKEDSWLKSTVTEFYAMYQARV